MGRTTGEWISLREFAKRLDVNNNAVQQALSNGRIVRRTSDKLIHWESQSKAWDELRDLSKVRDNAIDEAEEEVFLGNTSYQEAKIRREIANAGLKELELKRALGEVVDVGHVRAGMTQFAGDVREAVLTIPERSASEVAAEIAAICPSAGMDLVQQIVTRVLKRESRHVLEMISDVADRR